MLARITFTALFLASTAVAAPLDVVSSVILALGSSKCTGDARCSALASLAPPCYAPSLIGNTAGQSQCACTVAFGNALESCALCLVEDPCYTTSPRNGPLLAIQVFISQCAPTRSLSSVAIVQNANAVGTCSGAAVGGAISGTNSGNTGTTNNAGTGSGTGSSSGTTSGTSGSGSSGSGTSNTGSGTSNTGSSAAVPAANAAAASSSAAAAAAAAVRSSSSARAAVAATASSSAAARPASTTAATGTSPLISTALPTSDASRSGVALGSLFAVGAAVVALL